MNTHQARAAQHHGEPLPEPIQPGEGEAVRYGMEKAKKPMGKAEARRRKGEKPGYFNVNRFDCWMMGNGQNIR